MRTCIPGGSDGSEASRRVVEEGRAVVDAQWLRSLALRCGADLVGLVSGNDPAVAEQRAAAMTLMHDTRAFVCVGIKVHRENTRSPARSLFNLEQRRNTETLELAARQLAVELEKEGIRAAYVPPAFPMDFTSPVRISHKTIAEAAGVGRIGLNRLVLHPLYGSCILLATVLIDLEASDYDKPLPENPCLDCKLCVAACPTGAIAADGHFNPTACLTHNYRHRLGGFQNWVETLVDSGSAREYRSKVTDVETLEMWQGLTYEASNRCAYCVSVCPAGQRTRPAYEADTKRYVEQVVSPLREKPEVVYAVPGSDADGYAEAHFRRKVTRHTRSGRHASTIAELFSLMPIGFQRSKAAGVTTTYHFAFSGREPLAYTVTIRDQTISVRSGCEGEADLSIRCDSDLWLRILDGESSLFWAVLTRKLRFRGTLSLLKDLGRCLPG
jgi:epoxyqueuosine reductase QueG